MCYYVSRENPIKLIGILKEDIQMEITKQTTMGEMLEYDRGIAVILMQSGMHCVGCPASISETLEEACMVHGIDSDTVLADIKKYLAENNK